MNPHRSNWPGSLTLRMNDAAWEEYITRPQSRFGWNLAIVLTAIGAIPVLVVLIVTTPKATHQGQAAPGGAHFR